MATKKTKIIVNKFFAPSLGKANRALRIEYYVEAKPGRRWERVGGPFGEAEAHAVFTQYCNDHPSIPARVVVEQS